MAPPLRVTAEAESSTAVASLAATVPGSTQAGDLIVVVAGASSSATFNTTLAATVSGYTNRANERAGSAAFRLGVWTKVAGGTEGGTTVTPTLSSGTGRMIVQVRVYHSVDTTTPLDVAAVIASSDTESINVVAPAVTTVTDDAWTVSVHGQPTNSGTTMTSWTDPSGANNELISCSTDGTGNQAAVVSYDYDTGAAGTYGPYTAVSGQSRRWAAVTLALRPGARSISPTAVLSLGATADTSGTHSRSPVSGLSLGATAVVSKEVSIEPVAVLDLAVSAIIEPVQVEDLEVTVLMARDDGWRPARDETMAAKWSADDGLDQRVWRLYLDADGGGDPALAGRPAFAWSTDGTESGVITAYATDRAPVDPYGRVHLRVFLDVSNGAGGWTVTFEYVNGGGIWESVGTPVTGTPPTLLNPSGSGVPTTVGAVAGQEPLNSNPYFETNADDWFSTGTSSLVRSTAQSHQGSASLLATPTGAASVVEVFHEMIGVTPKISYSAGAWVRCATSRNVNMDIAYYDSGTSFLSSSGISTAVSADTWTYVQYESVAPEGAAYGRLVSAMTGTPSAGTLLYIDEAEFTVVDNFSGRAYSFQSRVGRTGEILVSADFTNHPAGTEMFTDNQGNVWDVHAPASLTSSQSLATIAILGPLATDECASWTDFTSPRSGVGRTCDHEPEECCSYYRARTIVREGGQLLVSDWSSDSGPDMFCLIWDEDEHLIRTTGPDGPMHVGVAGKFDWSVDKPFTSSAGINGTRFVTSAPPGGRNLDMTAAVESESALAELHAVLARPLVLISPSDASEVWAAPVKETVRVIRIGRIRQITASFIGTGPEPPPQTSDVGV